MKKKILVITDRYPYPIVKGDQVITSQIIESYSSRGFSISLLCHHPGEEVVEGNFELTLVSKSLYPFKLGWKELCSDPLHSFRMRSRDFLKRFNEFDEHFDEIHIVTLRMSWLLGFINKTNSITILHLIDSETRKFGSMISSSTGLRRQLVKQEYRRLKKYEPAQIRKAHVVTVVSRLDREYLGASLENIWVVPIMKSLYAHSEISENSRIIFTGNLGYQPNKEGLLWFLESVFPFILLNKAITFVICGSGDSSYLKKYTKKYGNSIVITGFVDDLKLEIARSQLSVAPIFSGSGVQNKILEAMVSGVPVVTTKRGAEPIGLINDYSALIAEDALDFGRCCIRLMDQEKLRKSLTVNALRIWTKHYSPEAIKKCYEKIQLTGINR